jgi:hypothetical protein
LEEAVIEILKEAARLTALANAYRAEPVTYTEAIAFVLDCGCMQRASSPHNASVAAPILRLKLDHRSC